MTSNTGRAQRLSWDRPLKDIWKELAEPANNDLDMPYMRKLNLLVQLRTADAVARYTKSLMLLTAIVVLCTVVEAALAVLTYLRPSS